MALSRGNEEEEGALDGLAAYEVPLGRDVGGSSCLVGG